MDRALRAQRGEERRTKMQMRIYEMTWALRMPVVEEQLLRADYSGGSCIRPVSPSNLSVGHSP